MLRDFVYGFRRLVRHPFSSALTIVTLSIGIGGATVVFVVADQVLLRPLPFPDPNRLVIVGFPAISYSQHAVDVVPEMRSVDAFEDLGVYIAGAENLGEADRARRVGTAAVSAGFFRVLAVGPLLGRTFRDDDDARASIAVVGYSLWRDVYGADPTIVNRTTTISGNRYRIVGVMPPAFRYPAGTQLWVPTLADPAILNGTSARNVLARIRSGVSLERASDGLLAAYTARLGAKAAQRLPRPLLTELSAHVTAPYRGVLLAALAIVVLLLAAACTSAACVLLSRLQARRHEIAIRRKLGARRRDLIAQSVSESAAVVSVAAPLGCLVAFWLAHVASSAVQRITAVAPLRADSRMLAAGSGITVIALLLISLVPALSAISGAPWPADRENQIDLRRMARLQSGLVMVQIALALVLATSALAAATSLRQLYATDLGFRNKRPLLVDFVIPSRPNSPSEPVSTTLNRIEDALHALPGVISVGSADAGPGGASAPAMTPLSLAERAITSEEGFSPTAELISVTPGFFGTLGIPLKAGRVFSTAEERGGPDVVILSERAVRTLGLSPRAAIGKRLPLGQQLWGHVQSAPTSHAEIVGVVGDVRLGSLADAAAPQIYQPFRKSHSEGHVSLALDVPARTPAVASAVAAAVAGVRPDVPVYDIRWAADLPSRMAADEGLAAFLSSASAVLGLSLASLGMFGLLSQDVLRRAREFGIRIALGENPDRLFRTILVRACALSVIGTAAGFVAGAGMQRIAPALVQRFAPAHPAHIMWAACTLITASILAAAIPARHASKCDPVALLHSD
jgi:predicted permease